MKVDKKLPRLVATLVKGKLIKFPGIFKRAKHGGKVAIVQDKIIAVSNSMGLPSDLALAVANQESRFQQSARSPVGAIGIFQLMPATARGLGVDPFNEDQNIQGGVSFLKQLYNKYNGDVPLTLAAYNAGPGNVSKYGGVPPFPETKNYISKILASLGTSPVVGGNAGNTDTITSDDNSSESGNISVDYATIGLVALAGVGLLIVLS